MNNYFSFADVSQSDIISQEEGKANNQDETIPGTKYTVFIVNK